MREGERLASLLFSQIEIYRKLGGYIGEFSLSTNKQQIVLLHIRLTMKNLIGREHSINSQ